MFDNSIQWKPRARRLFVCGAGLFVLVLVGLLAVVGSVPSTAQAAPAAGTIVNGNIITDTVWTKAGSPYTITVTSFRVQKDARLTIEPGVTVIMSENCHFGVDGDLVAEGTQDDPILITAASKEPGFWWGMSASGWGDEDPATLQLRYVTVEYGGSTVLPDDGNLELYNTVATISHSTFRHGGMNGISVDTGVQLTLADSHFTGNGSYPIRFSGSYGGAQDPVMSNLSASGNGSDVVGLYALNLEGNHIWERVGLPYVVDSGISVEEGASLTVQPGVEVRANRGFYVDGMLTAVGTPSQPITFTGVEKTPGGWWGLNVSGGFDSLASANLQHVVLEYGSNGASGGNLMINSAVVTLTDAVVRHSGGHGIANSGAAPGEGHHLTVADTAFVGNAGYAIYGDDESAALTLARLSANGNGLDAVVHWGSFGGEHVWRDAGLPYVITGTASSIGDGDSLTIEPGVEVRFAQNSYLRVSDGGTLMAEGTPTQPITFTGTSEQAGWWGGIGIGGQAILRHCNIGYGGGGDFWDGMVEISVSDAIVERCRLHHSATAGVDVRGLRVQPYIHFNRIEQNDFGLRNSQGGATPSDVDARNNWWGDPLGPFHPNLNPTGMGNAVSDRVLFEPWLTEADGGPSGGLNVAVMGPQVFSPGSTESYAIVYGNDGDTAVQNAVLVVTLPSNGDYVADSGGGILWPERNQIFWKLGALAPGSRSVKSVDVQYDWGMPDGSKEVVLAQLGGDDAGPAGFQATDYLAYVPRTVTNEVELDAAAVAAERQTYPQLAALFQGALDGGFIFSTASRLTLSTGQETTRFILLRFDPQFEVAVLWRHNQDAYGIFVDPSGLTVRRAGDALRYDLQTGGWEAVGGAVGAAATASTWSDCMEKCIIKKIPERLAKKFVPGVGAVKKVIDCAKAAEGDALSVVKCGNTVSKEVIKKEIPGLSDGIELGLCNSDCDECDGDCTNPKCHCCTEDKYICNEGGFPYWGVHTIEKYECDIETGSYKTFFGMLLSKTVQVCAACDKCMLNGNSASCVSANMLARLSTPLLVEPASLSALAANQDSECDECRQAKDPNAKYGAQGDLAPGQLITYTITYENVGQGEAYGVYVQDRLGEQFDAASLTVYGGDYVAASRSLFWDVGDLAPAGQPGATGVVSFSVRLRHDLPSGTVVTNGAVVHFPSVPEETPTNVVVNTIRPLAATPQQLETVSGQSLAIRLAGVDAAHAALTFTVVDEPLYGVLSGTAPNLTYIPQAGFVGQDDFEFTVSNGVSSSRPARITITVRPSPDDKTAPAVVWTAPGEGELVLSMAEPRFSDEQGMLYGPALQIQFSEAMDAATLTAATIGVGDSAGQTLPIRVRYDRATEQAVLFPAQPLQPGQTYTVTVGVGVKDGAGNALAAAHTWHFQTTDGDTSSQQIYLPLLER